MRSWDRKTRAARRAKLLAREWRVSAKGNPYLNVGRFNLCVFPSAEHEGRWSYRIDGRFGPGAYESPRAAQLAALEDLDRSTRRESVRTMRVVRNHAGGS